MSQILGLTGGIGSGKSSVAAIFAELGAEIIDADQLAREAVLPGSPGLEKITSRFGNEILRSDGTLDRKALGKIVFRDKSAREDLNKIVHPEVKTLAIEAMQKLIKNGAALIIYDVALLYENKLEATLPAVIVVHVSADIQRERIQKRDGLTDQEITARIATQANLDEKAQKADYLIDNRGSPEDTRTQVIAMWKQLTQEN